MKRVFQKIKNLKFVKNFKSLPVNIRKLLSVGILFALVIALPLFVLAIINQNFDLRKKAATGEIPPSLPPSISCNYTVNPPKTCPDGWACKYNSDLAGADGICEQHQYFCDGTPGNEICPTGYVCTKTQESCKIPDGTIQGPGIPIYCDTLVRPYCRKISECVPRPPCLDGVVGPNGTTMYCASMIGINYCPPISPTPPTPKCITEGGWTSGWEGIHTPCCSGLSEISISTPQTGEICRDTVADAGICTNCGDGSCGKGENKCNCPKDCPDNTVNNGFKCTAVGTRSEGWSRYGKFIKWAKCTSSCSPMYGDSPNGESTQFQSCIDCKTYCDGIGTTSEGWYSSCDKSLIILEKCGTTTPLPTSTPKCITEGGWTSGWEGIHTPCCSGLSEISISTPQTGEICRDTVADAGICTNCGDGSCGKGENKCNCPKDCQFVSPTPTSSPTPPPTATGTGPMKIKVKFVGVTDGSADGAKITLRVFKESHNDYITSPFSVSHIGNGVYEALIQFEPNTSVYPGNGNTFYIKGEKHLSRKFCYQTGQTELCGNSQGQITLYPANSLAIAVYDLTGLPLEPGDLPLQDGVVNSGDFQKIKTILSKLSSNITQEDLYTADLNYDGRVNIQDAFLLRKTLETKYDEN